LHILRIDLFNASFRILHIQIFKASKNRELKVGKVEDKLRIRYLPYFQNRKIMYCKCSRKLWRSYL